MGQSRADQKDRYAAVIDQDLVTDEVRDIALQYDPLNRSGRDGFHVTEDGELHIDDEKVIEEHRIVANKIPNDAIEIVRLPAERGQLIHQYGENGFRLYELPAPTVGTVVGVLGPNGVGKSTALGILSGSLKPNLGVIDDTVDWADIVREFRGTAVQTYLERLREDDIHTVYKPQRVDRIADQYSGSVRELLTERDERDAVEATVNKLDLAGLCNRTVDALSGGELQRVAIAATVVTDADTYLIDEPSSYLDVDQRLRVGRVLESLAEGNRVVVVDHDLITLDVVSDSIHVVYGEPGGFGVVSRPLSARRGINQFLLGDLRSENVRIRDDAVDFLDRGRQQVTADTPVLEFPALEKTFDSFSLQTEAGTLFEREVMGVFGQNGLGKTTFAKILAGGLEPDTGTVGADVTISYKPQYLEPAFDGTVGELFATEVETTTQRFRTQIEDPLDLEPLSERPVGELSGGELQRVGIGLALGRRADIYLLDEPSAYLDVRQRTSFATTLRSFVEQNGTPCLVIDHDLLLLDYVADRAMVFEGVPGDDGIGRSPQPVREGINRFLQTVEMTFRRDPTTGRPRANKPGSQKDEAQKRSGDYYAI